MLDPEQEQEVAPAPPRHKRLRAMVSGAWRVLRAIFGFLPELGLLLFMLIMPLIIVAYPAWRVSDRLQDYAVAKTVEVKLTHIDMRTVDVGQDQATPFEARKHIDVVFYFLDAQKKEFATNIEVAWPAPGLKGKLENQYPLGDNYTLYLLPDQSIAMEDVVAKDSFYRLTELMGLAFIASALMYLMWKRLKHRMPANMPRFPVATEHSIMLAQLITLLVAALWAGLMSVSPMVIQVWAYVAVYWTLVALLSLSLRLLVFSDAVSLEELAEHAEHDRRNSDADRRRPPPGTGPGGDNRRTSGRDRRSS